MERNEVVVQLNKVDMYISKKKYMEADKILDDLLKNADYIEINEYGKILDFNNQLEFVLYCNMNNCKKVAWKRNFLSIMYFQKGIICYENMKYKEAMTFYEKALKWNPVDFKTYAEILETCIKLHDYKKFDNYFEKAVQISIRPIQLAILYRKRGFVCVDLGKDEVGYNNLLYSKLFFPRKEADVEIAYLEKKFGTKLKYFPDIGTVKFIEKMNMQYVMPEYVCKVYFSIIKFMNDVMIKEEMKTKENYLMLIDYYHSLYFFSPNETIHNQMLAIQREYELKFPVSKEEK